MIVGRIIRGEYVRGGADRGVPARAPRFAPVDDGGDYFRGVKPSDLSRLDNRQLYMAASKIHESVISGNGTDQEKALASEALSACYTERRRRLATLR